MQSIVVTRLVHFPQASQSAGSHHISLFLTQHCPSYVMPTSLVLHMHCNAPLTVFCSSCIKKRLPEILLFGIHDCQVGSQCTHTHWSSLVTGYTFSKVLVSCAVFVDIIVFVYGMLTHLSQSNQSDLLLATECRHIVPA